MVADCVADAAFAVAQVVDCAVVRVAEPTVAYAVEVAACAAFAGFVFADYYVVANDYAGRQPCLLLQLVVAADAVADERQEPADERMSLDWMQVLHCEVAKQVARYWVAMNVKFRDEPSQW
jgi:hypothetical protein